MMKTINLWLGLNAALLLVGCWSDEVRDFIPGTYVNAATGEFSVASDTLEVELVEANQYQVLRSTAHHRIGAGTIGPRRYVTERWSCTYHGASQTLTERKRGKVISFFPNDRVLRVGTRVYQKNN